MAERRQEGKVTKGGMTVQEAGRKGGETVLQQRGPEFFSEIGKKGGQRVRELIEMAKAMEAGETPTRRRSTSRKTSR